MTAIPSRISTFVASLEHHPQAASLIPLVEQLFSVEDPTVEVQLTTTIQDICGGNDDLLVNLWTLRGIIQLEEGQAIRALSTFWKGLHFHVHTRSSWQRVIEIFIQRQDLIKATFFLIEGQKVFPNDEDFIQLFQHISQQLFRQVQPLPGIRCSTILSDPLLPLSVNEMDIASSSSSPDRKKGLKISSSVQNLWDQAQECFQEFKSSHEQIFTQAFVHYAHSTLRELFGLDGNFRTGIDQVIEQFQLTDYKQFLYWLNRLRNLVEQENYFPSEHEITRIYNQVRAILTLFESFSRQ